jgi:DNA-binding CsgD family transcriptional regulator
MNHLSTPELCALRMVRRANIITTRNLASMFRISSLELHQIMTQEVFPYDGLGPMNTTWRLDIKRLNIDTRRALVAWMYGQTREDGYHMSTRNIASMFGIDKRTVKNDLDAMNVTTRSQGNAHPIREQLTYEAMVALRKSKTMQEIADSHRVSLRLVEQIWTDVNHERPINILSTPWVPVIDADGTTHTIRVVELANERWIEINTGHAVTDMAVRLFLIGLMQSVVGKVSRRPNAVQFQSILSDAQDAFFLTGKDALFLQSAIEASTLKPPHELLPWTASGNTLTRNADIFNERQPYRT